MSAVPNLPTLVAWPGLAQRVGCVNGALYASTSALHSSTLRSCEWSFTHKRLPIACAAQFQTGLGGGPLIYMVKTDWVGHHVKFCICLGKRKGEYRIGRSR